MREKRGGLFLASIGSHGLLSQAEILLPQIGHIGVPYKKERPEYTFHGDDCTPYRE
jgi:hypothetical protein